jgi:hypothetical protein
MQKIPTVFQRNHDGDRLVRDEVTPGCEWVLAGAGRPTIKIDGTCCMISGGKLYKRREVKSGQPLPPDFTPIGEVDEVTGKRVGWVPVGDGPEDQYHREALQFLQTGSLALEGTYELVGPKIQGNPYEMSRHFLIPHGSEDFGELPHTFEGLQMFFEAHVTEGVVWHHPDGRMAKLKRRDFGFPWPVKRGE